MNKTRLKPAIIATLVVAATVVSAAVRPLPTPQSSPFPDRESSINVSLPDWPALGRRITLSLSANFTPSNCVQVAFGQDADSDGDLAPEETHLVLGVDCGVPFARNEVKVRGEGEQWNLSTYSAGQPEQEDNTLCSPSPSTFTFSFKQPSAVAKRITHAKITTRGRGPTAAQIAAEIRKPGKVLFLR